MAGGDRTTKRERREESKKRRMEELRRRQRKARMRKIYTIGGVAVVLLGIIAAIVLAAGGKEDNTDLAALAAAAGCEDVKNPPQEGRDHKPPFTYKTNPPTSGNHDGRWANTGIFSTAPPDANLVHNLEHGHVIIWYKPDLDPTILDGLKGLVRKEAARLIVVPRADMPYTVAFTAWTRIQGCANPNAKVVDAAEEFIKRFKNKAPEQVAGTPTGV